MVEVILIPFKAEGQTYYVLDCGPGGDAKGVVAHKLHNIQEGILTIRCGAWSYIVTLS
jgi:hypothetical protein